MSKVKIGDITTSCLGKMLDVEKNKGEYEPYLANINVRWGSFELDNLQMMRFEPDEQERYEVLDGDLIMCEGGEPGRCAIWRSELPEMKIQKALHRIRAKEGTDIEYLYYWFLHAGRNHLIDGYFTGSTIKHLPGDKLKLIEIDLPDYISQKKISGLLSKIDAKIKNNISICSDLESMVKLLYDYWFVQFDFPDENGRLYKSSGGKMVWNEDLKREIPEGWEVKRIGDIISTERGISYSTPNIITGEGVPMLNLATFKPGGGDYKADGLKHYLGDYPKNKVLQPFDLIMCNTQQTAIKFETDIIGRAMLVPDIFDKDVVFSHHVNVIRTKDENMKYYLLFLFNSDYYHKYISGYTNGTNILGLSFNGVEDYLTEIPASNLLEGFAKTILTMEKKKSEILVENQQLASLRDFLLPMLMNGQVQVGKAGE